MRFGILLLLVVTACKRRIEAEPSAASPDPGEALVTCPAGAVQEGNAPPAGTEVWCQLLRPNGEAIRHGPTIAWYTAEQKRFEGAYHSGKLMGAWLGWHPNGETSEEGSYNQGERHGYWVEYHDNGERKSAGEYLGGMPNGPWTYWASTGAKETEGNYLQGSQDGVWTSFDSDGKPRVLRHFRAGALMFHEEL